MLTKTPLRISFAGGGSDLPAFYAREPGCVVNVAIQQYVYVDEDGNSKSDLPSGRGLSSSSAWTVGRIKAAYPFLGPAELARRAFVLERSERPCGAQDCYACAYGGLNAFSFYSDDSVRVEPLPLPELLQDHLLMFYLGDNCREAGNILRDQEARCDRGAARALAEQARWLKEELYAGRVDSIGWCLREGWKIKRRLAAGITNAAIDEAVEKAARAGAAGAKLLGAGGGGYVLAYTENADARASVLAAFAGTEQLEIAFDLTGCQFSS